MYVKVGVAKDEALAGGAGLSAALERCGTDQDLGCRQVVGGAGEAAAPSRLAVRLGEGESSGKRSVNYGSGETVVHPRPCGAAAALIHCHCSGVWSRLQGHRHRGGKKVSFSSGLTANYYTST